MVAAFESYRQVQMQAINRKLDLVCTTAVLKVEVHVVLANAGSVGPGWRGQCPRSD